MEDMFQVSKGLYGKNKKPWINLTPAQILVMGFAGLILLGGLVLTTPMASESGEMTPFIDALFTATTAVCVTGLVVVDTATHWSTFGEIVILLLVQIGGLGFMTMATLFSLLLGKKINLKERLLMQEALNTINLEGLVRLTKYILAATFLIEGIAALLLASRWSIDMGWPKALYYGVFHAVTGFNNAGIDLFGDFRSLTGYADDILINLVISTLIILGGLGFTVLADLYQKRSLRAFSLHTKIVLVTSGFLIVVGTAAIFLLEYSNPKTLGNLGLLGKTLASYFQAVTPRTAGYNTLIISDLRQATQFLIVILMFIGASPGSTGGGIKTTTFATLISAVWASIRGREDIQVFERRVPKERVYKSLTIVLLAIALVSGVTMALTITEAGHSTFLEANFETVSAFATVGLTMGLTPKLTEIGRLIIIFTMFAGRVGPLTIAVAMAQKRSKSPIHYVEEKIIIG